jgi:hypothetical protein
MVQYRRYVTFRYPFEDTRGYERADMDISSGLRCVKGQEASARTFCGELAQAPTMRDGAAPWQDSKVVPWSAGFTLRNVRRKR